MLVPLLQVRLILVIFHLILFNELLQENFQVSLVLRQRQSQRSQKRVCVGFDLGKWFVLQFSSDT